MITDLKDLQKLLKLCRSQGITEIKLQGVEIKFGDMPTSGQVGNSSNPTEEPESLAGNKYAGFPTGELTPEQLIFYSSGGLPEDDLVLKEETA